MRPLDIIGSPLNVYGVWNMHWVYTLFTVEQRRSTSISRYSQVYVKLAVPKVKINRFIYSFFQ